MLLIKRLDALAEIVRAAQPAIGLALQLYRQRQIRVLDVVQQLFRGALSQRREPAQLLDKPIRCGFQLGIGNALGRDAVWFGIGQLPKVLLIALGTAIPLYLNTFAGIRGVDGKLADVGRALGLSRGDMLRHVVLPGALPEILVGLRQSLGVAWLSLVVAEQLNTNAGLGFIINQATQFLQNDVILVALLVYTALGLTTDWLVRSLERRALAWRRGLLTP